MGIERIAGGEVELVAASVYMCSGRSWNGAYKSCILQARFNFWGKCGGNLRMCRCCRSLPVERRILMTIHSPLLSLFQAGD